VKTKLSTKGQVVIPRAVREKLQLRAGDTLETSLDGGRIVLVPVRKRKLKWRITRSRLTGLPVLTAGRNAPQITNEQVAEILADFP
jgi:AbrB family looped-hinge helix DNA binding protein